MTSSDPNDFVIEEDGEIITEGDGTLVLWDDEIHLRKALLERLHWGMCQVMARQGAEVLRSPGMTALRKLADSLFPRASKVPSYLTVQTSQYMAQAGKPFEFDTSAAEVRVGTSLHQAIEAAQAMGVGYPTEFLSSPEAKQAYREWKERTFFQRYAADYSVIEQTGDRIPPSYTLTGTDTTPGPQCTGCVGCGGPDCVEHPEIKWCDCESGVVCELHQRTMSDGRAPCKPFHPAGGIKYGPDGSKPAFIGYYCARCGHRFPKPTPDLISLDLPCCHCGGSSKQSSNPTQQCPYCITGKAKEYEWATNPYTRVENDGTKRSFCGLCHTEIWYQDCPTGGWWIHERHPMDDHDAFDQFERPE